MSVHIAISAHVKKQNKKINDFLVLNQQRENYIEEALQLCKLGQAFSIEKINEVTNQINTLARTGIIPTRKLVTTEMIREYALKVVTTDN